jgi:hypothetical protein
MIRIACGLHIYVGIPDVCDRDAGSARAGRGPGTTFYLQLLSHFSQHFLIALNIVPRASFSNILWMNASTHCCEAVLMDHLQLRTSATTRMLSSKPQARRCRKHDMPKRMITTIYQAAKQYNCYSSFALPRGLIATSIGTCRSYLLLPHELRTSTAPHLELLRHTATQPRYLSS